MAPCNINQNSRCVTSDACSSWSNVVWPVLLACEVLFLRLCVPASQLIQSDFENVCWISKQASVNLILTLSPPPPPPFFFQCRQITRNTEKTRLPYCVLKVISGDQCEFVLIVLWVCMHHSIVYLGRLEGDRYCAWCTFLGPEPDPEMHAD